MYKSNTIYYLWKPEYNIKVDVKLLNYALLYVNAETISDETASVIGGGTCVKLSWRCQYITHKYLGI